MKKEYLPQPYIARRSVAPLVCQWNFYAIKLFSYYIKCDAICVLTILTSNDWILHQLFASVAALHTYSHCYQSTEQTVHDQE